VLVGTVAFPNEVLKLRHDVGRIVPNAVFYEELSQQMPELVALVCRICLYHRLALGAEPAVFAVHALHDGWDMMASAAASVLHRLHCARAQEAVVSEAQQVLANDGMAHGRWRERIEQILENQIIVVRAEKQLVRVIDIHCIVVDEHRPAMQHVLLLAHRHGIVLGDDA